MYIEAMTRKLLKSITFALLLLASCILAVLVINFNTFPTLINYVLAHVYLFLMLPATIFFIVCRRTKTRFDNIIPALYLLHGLTLLFALVIYITYLAKHL